MFLKYYIDGGKRVFGSTDLALKIARIVDFCGKSSGLADFENTVDRGSAVIFDADFGLFLSYVGILGPKRNLDHRSFFSLGRNDKGTFFLCGGRAGEFWYFFPKKVLTLPCNCNKKLLTPCSPPSSLPSLLHGMFHAVETTEHFACERKMFEYKYLTIIHRGGGE